MGTIEASAQRAHEALARQIFSDLGGCAAHTTRTHPAIGRLLAYGIGQNPRIIKIDMHAARRRTETPIGKSLLYTTSPTIKISEYY